MFFAQIDKHLVLFLNCLLHQTDCFYCGYPSPFYGAWLQIRVLGQLVDVSHLLRLKLS